MVFHFKDIDSKLFLNLNRMMSHLNACFMKKNDNFCQIYAISLSVWGNELKVLLLQLL